MAIHSRPITRDFLPGYIDKMAAEIGPTSAGLSSIDDKRSDVIIHCAYKHEVIIPKGNKIEFWPVIDRTMDIITSKYPASCAKGSIGEIIELDTADEFIILAHWGRIDNGQKVYELSTEDLGDLIIDPWPKQCKILFIVACSGADFRLNRLLDLFRIRFNAKVENEEWLFTGDVDEMIGVMRETVTCTQIENWALYVTDESTAAMMKWTENVRDILIHRDPKFAQYRNDGVGCLTECMALRTLAHYVGDTWAVDELMVENAKLTAENAKLTTKLADKNARQATEIARWACDVSILADKNARQAAITEHLAAKNERLTNENFGLTAKLAQQTADRVKLAGDDSELVAENAKLMTKVGQLLAKNEQLTGENAGLAAEITLRTCPCAELAKNGARLVVKNTKLTDENTMLATQMAAGLTDEITRLTAESARLLAKNERLTDENIGLTIELARRTANCAGLTGDCAELATENTGLTAETTMRTVKGARSAGATIGKFTVSLE